MVLVIFTYHEVGPDPRRCTDSACLSAEGPGMQKWGCWLCLPPLPLGQKVLGIPSRSSHRRKSPSFSAFLGLSARTHSATLAAGSSEGTLRSEGSGALAGEVGHAPRFPTARWWVLEVLPRTHRETPAVLPHTVFLEKRTRCCAGEKTPTGAKPLPKIMNLSSEHCNASDWLRLEATVKASVYLVAFSFATAITVLIIAVVSQSPSLRSEARHVLLCHHLLCVSSCCGLGAVFQGLRALRAGSPLLLCWVVFGAQLSAGEGILFTLALMALNTYAVICWPLRPMPFVDSVKYRILAGAWAAVILKNVCLFLIESASPTVVSVFRSEPLCPVILNGAAARAIGMVFLFLPLSVILVPSSLLRVNRYYQVFFVCVFLKK
ncbi:uncharacterized protein LOC105862887 isoform X2 [Microcebus murinus]|uniref:uncharacterized protein LOC105862887 isoform X2 n=1 Tax=Microcebus murinus TaxID=30608 RepID=UPI003F6B80B6